MSAEKPTKPPSPVPRLLLNPVRVAEVLRLTLVWIKTYFGAQAKTDVANAAIIEMPVDDRIAPEESAIYPYLFASIYVLYVIWHMLDRLPVAHYRAARDAYRDMIKEAESVFLRRPTRMSNRNRLNHPLTRFMQTVDGPVNCFPSLHVALVVFSYQVIKDGPDTDQVLLGAMRQSCVDISRSTLQTKQHSVIDVIGGIALSRAVYRDHFDGPFEDLLTIVFPELTEAELSQVRVLLEKEFPMIELLDKLIELFGSPT